MKKILTIFVLLMSLTAYSQGESLDNQKVIELKKLNISKILIIKTIDDATNFNFDLSTIGLQELAKNKVDDDIIVLMMDKQKQNEKNSIKVDNIIIDGFGLFIVEDKTKKEIIAHSSSGTSFKGRSIMIGMNGKTSENIISNLKPTFYFSFDNGAKQNDSPALAAFSTIKSPSEGFLVKFRQSKNDRDLEIGKAGIGGFQVKVEKQNRVDYTVEKIKENFYKIQVLEYLKPGEYGFIFGQMNSGTANRVYDFTIK
ncbi:MAG: hypothetical protein LC112_10435 [Flavobacteriales bacterium]|nr:hypothetical protein [Flavobacteriales bacterium]